MNIPADQLVLSQHEPFWTNEDLNDDDRKKAVAWASAINREQKPAFLPENTLKYGFRIKKFFAWMPVEIAVDYEHHRFTLSYGETVLVRNIHCFSSKTENNFEPESMETRKSKHKYQDKTLQKA